MRDDIVDSRQLLAFRTLASTGSFTLAANQLNLTQSAVSHSIKALEEDLGCSLMIRLGRKIHLTESGELLLATADRVIRQMQSVRAELTSLGKWGMGRLRVGAGTTACQHILPSVIREFRVNFPDCELSIKAHDAQELLQLLRSNELDIALTLGMSDIPDIEFQPIFSDCLQFVVSPLHAWAGKRQAPLKEVSQQTFIVYNKKSYTFELIRRYFRSYGIELNNLIELGSMEAIKELVKAGTGVGVLAPWLVKKEVQGGVLCSLGLGRKPLKREWGICSLKGKKLSLKEETFLGLCESYCEGID